MIFIGGSIDTLQRLENGLVPKLSRYTISYYAARSKREMLKRDQVWMQSEVDGVWYRLLSGLQVDCR
jgi:hypothetical protein